MFGVCFKGINTFIYYRPTRKEHEKLEFLINLQKYETINNQFKSQIEESSVKHRRYIN